MLYGKVRAVRTEVHLHASHKNVCVEKQQAVNWKHPILRSESLQGQI